MLLDNNEEELLRSVALQNARAVLHAREQAERESEETKRRLANILESITDGFYVLDKDWRFVYLNTRGEEIIRHLHTQGSLIGKSIWEEFPFTVGSDIEKNYRRAVREQVTVIFDTYIEAHNQWFEVRAYPTPDGLSVYFHDITARKKGEEIQQRLAAVVESSDDAIISLNLDTTITTWNRGAQRMFGYTADEAIGKSVSMLIPPESDDEEPRILQRIIEGERVDHYETIRAHKDGHLLDVSLTVSPIFDSNGKIIGASKISRDITDSKKISETQQRLISVIESTDDAIITLGLDTTITTWNRGAERMFGYTAAEAIGKSVSMLIPPESDDEEPRILKRIIDGERVDHYETIRAHKDGHLLNVSLTVSPILDSNGRIIGASKISRDITDTKRVDETQQRLSAVVESSDDAIISMGLDTIITTWNQGAERMFGYTAQEAIGRSVSMLIPPDSEDEEPKILQRILKGERVDHYETVRARKDGGLLDVSLTVSPIFDSNGKIIGVSKSSRNITDRKRAEAALREETRILELLNDTGKAIASQLDLHNVVQTVTDSGTKLTGARFGAFFYNVTNKDGESFQLFTLSGAPREAFEKFGHPRATPIFAPIFRGEGPIRSDDITKDGSYGKWPPHHGMPEGHLPVRSYLAVPVSSRTGQVIGGLFFGHPDVGIFTERAERLIVGVAAQAAIAIDNARLYDAAQREISERKRVEEALRAAQEELRQHANKLEDQVAERTARLRETIQELEAFSYSVSHDMRSPLRAMQGYSETLLEEHSAKLDPQARDYLARIRRAASRMDLLIQDVLAYSRVAKSEIELQVVKVENVIADVIQHYPALQPDRADITVHTPFPPVWGHEAYLTQIVSNLLTNAVKFMAPGVRPKVEISSVNVDDMVRFTFQDNGIGIAPEHLKQIFQMFGRVYSEKKFEGTGIGLAIAKKASERMGGAISVDSELGRGSKFTVLLKQATQANLDEQTSS